VSSPARSVELLVLGLGNVLCGDDGLGPAVVDRLDRDWSLPEGCSALDGGTLGLSLLPVVEDARRVILVDAVRLDAAPGTLVRLEGEAVGSAVRDRLSVHQIGVADLVDALRLRGRLPEELVLIGAVPGSLAVALGLSPAVDAALPGVLDGVVAEAARLGFPCRRRDPQESRRAPHARALFGL